MIVMTVLTASHCIVEVEVDAEVVVKKIHVDLCCLKPRPRKDWNHRVPLIYRRICFVISTDPSLELPHLLPIPTMSTFHLPDSCLVVVPPQFLFHFYFSVSVLAKPIDPVPAFPKDPIVSVVHD
jgi:hypothetical protein